MFGSRTLRQYHSPSRRWRFSRLLAVAVAAAALLLGLAAPALAEPATTVNYTAGASATRYSGLAFDTCTAPPLTAIRAWAASPYRALGVYIGGVNRTCKQPELTATWVTAVSGLKWRLLPIYKGLQAPCGGKVTDQKITPSVAVSQGRAAAGDAVAKAKALGMTGGSALYNDMEPYTATDASCRATVLQYLSGWTKETHRLGYVAGVYAQLSSGARNLAESYTSTSYARPDALWIARYDGVPALSGWAGVPDSNWAVHQRAKQYRNSHNETYGGVTINIDNDRVDAPVATVGYSYRVTSGTPLNARSGPSASYPVVGTRQPGSTLRVLCQAPGSAVSTTSRVVRWPGSPARRPAPPWAAPASGTSSPTAAGSPTTTSPRRATPPTASRHRAASSRSAARACGPAGPVRPDCLGAGRGGRIKVRCPPM